MGPTRIRWSSLGRVAGGLAAAGGLIVVVPSLLEPAAPQRLPADVGLATGASGPYAFAPAPEPDRAPERSHPRRHRSESGGRPKRPVKPTDGGDRHPPAAGREPEPALEPEPPITAPATVALPAAPSAPAPEPPPPEPAPSAPAPEPDPEPERSPPSPQPPTGSNQFGFER